jgi:DNA invertase Pin-like site-specific DNA recombinase
MTINTTPSLFGGPGGRVPRPWATKHQPSLAEWAEVRRLHNQGASVRAIARGVGVSRRSVRHILYPWQRS